MLPGKDMHPPSCPGNRRPGKPGQNSDVLVIKIQVKVSGATGAGAIQSTLSELAAIRLINENDVIIGPQWNDE